MKVEILNVVDEINKIIDSTVPAHEFSNTPLTLDLKIYKETRFLFEALCPTDKVDLLMTCVHSNVNIARLVLSFMGSDVMSLLSKQDTFLKWAIKCNNFEKNARSTGEILASDYYSALSSIHSGHYLIEDDTGIFRSFRLNQIPLVNIILEKNNMPTLEG